ncbi:cell division protein FtsX [Glycocaulis abyssi]|uniref:Cell division protein FtsX n=1 Tax=Glycocaulis abyssi TaxID=1433403 RepID=A0ABV9NB11_9PROT
MTKPRRSAPLLPGEAGRDLPLLAVCAILVFLACLSVIGAAGAWRAAGGWSDQLVSEMTLQVLPADEGDGDAAARDAGALASGLPGVIDVEVRSRAASTALLRPWLGSTTLPDDFPLPRLVTLRIDPENRPASGAVEALFADAPYRVIVDDNRLWAGAIARASATVRYFAAGLVLLVCGAAAAVIVFAARAALSMRRDVAEALHLVGAPDSFIIALFQQRFFMLGLKAGAAGSLLALLAALCLNLAGGSAASLFFLPSLAPGWWIVIIVPVAALVSGLISAIAARLTVSAGLKARWP